jgi:hypothetical protein
MFDFGKTCMMITVRVRAIFFRKRENSLANYEAHNIVINSYCCNKFFFPMLPGFKQWIRK